MKWALVLSGGGANGIAHVGIIKGLDTLGVRPSLIVGTSMGAIIGGLYACGYSGDEIEKIVLEEFEFDDYIETSSPAIFKKSSLLHIFQFPEFIASITKGRGAIKGEKLMALFDRLTDKRDIKETSTQFVCNAVDLLTGEEVFLEEGSLAKAIRASMAVPGIFHPVEWGDMLLTDGGVADNMPTVRAWKAGFKRILACNATPLSKTSPQTLKTGLHVLFRAINIMAPRRHMFSPSNCSDLVIDVSDGNSYTDFNSKLDLIKEGDEAFKENEERICSFLKVKRAIKKQNQM